MRNLKILGVALAAVFAMSAVMAAGASAQLAGAGLTTWNTSTGLHETANLTGVDIKTNPPVFRATAGGAPVTCEEASYTGTTSGTEATPKATPVYKGCHTILGGSKLAANVRPNGCEYQFHIDKEEPAGSGKFAGHISIVCPAGKEIEVEVPATGCIDKIGAANNSAINGVTYENKTAEGTTHVDIIVNATNVHNVTNLGLLSCGVSSGTHATGTFGGSVTVTAKNTAGNPIDVKVTNKTAT